MPEFPRSPLTDRVHRIRETLVQNKRLTDPSFIQELRRHIDENNSEIERLRKDQEEVAKWASKRREIFVRNFRRCTSSALFQDKPTFVYAPHYYQLFRGEPTIKEVDEEESESEDTTEEPEIPSLPFEVLKSIEQCFLKKRDDIIVQDNQVEVRVKDLETLKGTNWLNDEIINCYFQLIQKRSAQNKEKPRVHCFLTFFYTRLKQGGGWSAVKNWTRRVNLFSYDLILIPVHLEVHWTLAAIDMRNQTINYYDSMNGNNHDCLRILLKYLEDEYKKKKDDILDTSKWKTSNIKGIPRQENGSDCGVFTCKYAERLSIQKPFNFSQRHIPFIRSKMIYEILKGELITDDGLDPMLNNGH